MSNVEEPLPPGSDENPNLDHGVPTDLIILHELMELDGQIGSGPDREVPENETEK